MPSNGGLKLNYGPIHNNSNITCAIDIRVGGYDPAQSDLLEIAFLPINHSYKLHPEFKMFTVKIRPSWKVDRKIAKLNDETAREYEQSPFDAIEAQDLFCRWFESLQLKPHKKIIPLVWDWSRVRPFLKMWLGDTAFENCISTNYRDLLPVVNFLNDRCDYWGEEVPAKTVDYAGAIRYYEIDLIDKRSVSANCMGLIDLNRTFLKSFIPGYVSSLPKT